MLDGQGVRTDMDLLHEEPEDLLSFGDIESFSRHGHAVDSGRYFIVRRSATVAATGSVLSGRATPPSTTPARAARLLPAS
jgi:hypothetical protein